MTRDGVIDGKESRFCAKINVITMTFEKEKKHNSKTST